MPESFLRRERVQEMRRFRYHCPVPEAPLMRAALGLLRARVGEVVSSIGPLIGMVLVLQLAVVQAPAAELARLLAGSVLVVLGLLLLLTGIDLGILPMGRFIGAALPRKGSLLLIAASAFGLGFATTLAEPDVLILASQVAEVSGGALRAQPLTWLIAAGVGLFSALALVRIVFGLSMKALFAAAYGLVLALSLVAPPKMIALAYDAGSVTTGVLSAPILLALALGLSSVVAGRSTGSDGFGLLGLASTGPIIAVLLLGLLSR